MDGISRLRAHLAGGRPFAFDDYLTRFSWDENARRTLAVYQSLLQQPSDAKGHVPCGI
jgi:hypothetical protein